MNDIIITGKMGQPALTRPKVVSGTKAVPSPVPGNEKKEFIPGDQVQTPENMTVMGELGKDKGQVKSNPSMSRQITGEQKKVAENVVQGKNDPITKKFEKEKKKLQEQHGIFWECEGLSKSRQLELIKKTVKLKEEGKLPSNVTTISISRGGNKGSDTYYSNSSTMDISFSANDRGGPVESVLNRMKSQGHEDRLKYERNIDVIKEKEGLDPAFHLAALEKIRDNRALVQEGMKTVSVAWDKNSGTTSLKYSKKGRWSGGDQFMDGQRAI